MVCFISFLRSQTEANSTEVLLLKGEKETSSARSVVGWKWCPTGYGVFAFERGVFVGSILIKVGIFFRERNKFV